MAPSTAATLTEAAEMIGAEAATLAEAAHRRRNTGAALTEAATGKPEVRRGQWIELTAEVLQHTRRQCRRHLPPHEAEEMAAEVLTRELEAALTERPPRRGCVRAERLTPTYLKLTARDWLTGREARRLEEMREDGAPDLAAEEVPELTEAEAEEEMSAEAIYRQAAEVARRLYLVADRPVIFALAAALADVPAADLASAWGVTAGTWKREAARGAEEVRACYPDLTELVARLVDADRTYARRRLPMSGTVSAEVADGAEVVADEDGNWCQHIGRRTVKLARRIGADLPETGRHRTTGQLAREADWLLSREQLPGRTAEASRATSGAWREDAAPDHWRDEVHRITLAEMLAEASREARRRYQVRRLTRRGARPHRQARGASAGLLPVTEQAAAPRSAGYGRTYPEGARCEVAASAARREAAAMRPPRLVVSQWTPQPRYSAPRHVAELGPEARRAEAIQRGEWLTRAETWRLIMAPRLKRTSVLTPRSLDVAAPGDVARWHDEEAWLAAEAN